MITLQNKKIFIIDDDPFWTATLTKMLKDLGYTNIVKYTTGRECVKNIHQNPGLIFMDYQMEDMDGLVALQHIKFNYPGMNVIFCTSHEDITVAVEAIKNGSFDYLLKSNATKKEVAQLIEEMEEKQLFEDKEEAVS